jgi:DNA-binding PadR family transcriptional regulator
MDEQGKKQAVLIAMSLTNGGRALNAVWRCKNLDSEEKLILLFIGSQLDFTGDFSESIQRYVSTIVEWTCLSKATVHRRLKSLQKKGYIDRTRKTLENGELDANEYRLTDLIFQEHHDFLTKKLNEQNDTKSQGETTPSLRERLPLVSGRDYPQSQGETTPSLRETHTNPSFSNPSFSNPSFSSDGGEKKKKKTPTPRKSYEHIGIVQSMDWLFKKTKNGGYEFEVANTWMEKLLKERGSYNCWNMSEWFGKKVEKFRETCRGAWVVSPASLEELIAFYDTQRDEEDRVHWKNHESGHNVSQSDNCSPVNRRQAPKPDWSLMQRQAEEDRAANGSLDSFPY